MRKLMFAAAAFVAGVIAPLTLGEGLLRLTNRPSPEVIGWTGDGGPGRRGWPGERNEFGFRGHDFDARAGVRIVLLGDSQVESAGTAFEDMPEVQLQTALAEDSVDSVSIASIASLGWGQDQELLALQEYVDRIRPTQVVLWFTESNDLWNNTFPTHLPKDGFPKPTFWLDGSALKGPNLPWLVRYRPPGLYLWEAIRRVQGVARYPTDGEWESRLPPPYRPSVPPPGAPSLMQALAEGHGMRVEELPYFNFENFETEKTHYSAYLVPESPRLAYAAALTRALLLRIRNLCEAKGARFVVLITQRWEASGLPERPTMFELGGKGYTFSQASARRVIDAVLQGLPTIRVKGLRPDAVISKADSHWNRDGNKYAMQWLGRELVRELHRGGL
ncbi:MAG: hypothetical protein ABJA98_10755 [Acidobacteriota bacterium]